MFALAWMFLADEPAFRTGVIVIGLARCIAMVLIWNDLACGDREAAALLVAINSVFQIARVRAAGHVLPDDPARLARPGHPGRPVLHLGDHQGGPDLPRHPAGRRATSPGGSACERKGSEWYEGRFLPRIGPFALYGLLFTIVVMFALQGDAILSDPASVVRIAIPLLVYFAIMWGVSFFLGVRARLGYPKTATLAFTAAGNNFELAIAVSIGVWGVTSGQALTGVIGPLIEVPALVGLVYVSLWLRRRLAGRAS